MRGRGAAARRRARAAGAGSIDGARSGAARAAAARRTDRMHDEACTQMHVLAAGGGRIAHAMLAARARVLPRASHAGGDAMRGQTLEYQVTSRERAALA